MTRYMNTTVAAIAALAMSGTAALAQEQGAGVGQQGNPGPGENTVFDFFTKTYGSEEIGYTDFNTAFNETGVFERYDADQDELLSRDELNRGLYTAYDADANDMLASEEVAGMARDPIFRDEAWGGQDEELAYGDFESQINNRPVWVGWDQDENGMITRDEFTRGLWATYDANQDNVLNVEEREAMGESRILRY